MDKREVIAFFDRCAPQWDAEMVRCDRIIHSILDRAGIKQGVHVLDVACGTGVLIPDYRERKVASVTGVDISPEMAKRAKEKFPYENVEIICGDVEELDFSEKFDCIMVYNAFPHFPNPQRLIEKLSRLLKQNGTLTIAHGMSRAKVDQHHSQSARSVSNGLMHEDELAGILERYFDITAKISNDEMYQVTGRVRSELFV